MTIAPEILKAIMSMDSYNRGYESGIGLPTIVGTTQLGNATIIASISDDDTGATDIGFYALAYEIKDENGNVLDNVISYRGTDSPNPIPDDSDVTNGWLLGAGNYNATQGTMAVQFYKDVAQEIGGSTVDLQTVNISATGHSLGGGLASYIGALYGQTADAFDSMGYLTAANNAHFYATIPESDPQYSTIAQPLVDLIYGGAEPEDIWDIDNSGVTARHLEGEVLHPDFARQAPSQEISLSSQINLVDSPYTSFTADPWVNTLFNLGVSAGDIAKESIARHDMALLIIRMFADTSEVSQDHWQASASYFLPVMFDAGFAASIGLDTHSSVSGRLQTDGNFASILRQIVAYSAIDEGERPFGDTGIRSLYDDANDLGAALTAGGSGSAIEVHAVNISKVLVQFAGQLALNEVLQSTVASAVDGILTYTDQSDDRSLAVNLSDNYWGLTTGTPLHNADVTRDTLINDALSASGHASVISNLTSQGWGDSTYGAFDRAVFAAKQGGTVFIAENGSYSDKGTLFIGGGTTDNVLGSSSDEVLLAGGGNDIIGASLGTDFAFGDAGDDVFHADSSLNQSLWFDGGADSDLVYLAGKSSSDYTQGTGHVYTSIADSNIVFEFSNVESVVFGNDLTSYAASMASIGSISINRIDPELYVKPLSSSNGDYTRDFSADGTLETSSSMLGEHTGASLNGSLQSSYVEWDMYRRSPDEAPSDPVTLTANSLVVDRYTITAPSGSSGWTEFSIILNEDIGGYFGKNELYGFDIASGVETILDLSTAATGYAGTLQYNYLGSWYDRNVDFADAGYTPLTDGITVSAGFVGSLQTEIQFRFTGPEITFDSYWGAFIDGLGHTGISSGKNYSGYGVVSSEIVVPTGANFTAESGYVPGGYDVSALQQEWLGTINADDFTGAGFSETVYTYEGADIIAASTGNDTLYGGVDSDTYVFNAGDGQDTINDVQGFDDAIRLGPGIVETDLTLTQVGNDLEITFAGTVTDKIMVASHYDTSAYSQIEKIIFDDDSELVLSVPDPSPILTNNGGAVDEDGSMTITAAMLDATDMDNTDTELVFTLDAIPADGVLKKDAIALSVNDSFTVQDILDSKITFDPAADFNGADGFGFSLTDGTATITGQSFAITVNSVNDAPLAQDDAFNGDEDTQITGNVLADNGNGADSDIDNDALSVTAGTFATAQGGSITLQSNGDFTYTPAASFTGTDSYQYTVSDGNGGQDTATASFTVSGSVEIAGYNDSVAYYGLLEAAPNVSTVDAVPSLDGSTNITSDGTLSSSGSPFSPYYDWRAFDGSVSGNAWSTDGAQRWAAFEFNEAKIIDRYMVASRDDYSNFAGAAPQAWGFLASNDGINWVTLDSVTGETSWGQGEARYYDIANGAAYLHYKINFTQTNGHFYTSIGEIDFIEADPTAQYQKLWPALSLNADDPGLNIQSAEVRLLNPSDGLQSEVLAISNTNLVTSSYAEDIATGDLVLTLSGQASISEYQSILRTVAYGNESQSPTAGVRNFEINILDSLNAVSSFNTALYAGPIPDAESVAARDMITHDPNGAPLTLIADGALNPSTVDALPSLDGSSYVTAEGTFTSSGSPFSPYYDWQAFDGSVSGNAWSTDSAQRWAAFEFNGATIINKYMVASRDDYSNFAEAAPKAWDFLASNDGVNWVVLDSVSGETSWGQGQARYYDFVNDTAYLHYKINFTQNNGHFYTSIGEVDFIEAGLGVQNTSTVDAVPSLDGTSNVTSEGTFTSSGSPFSPHYDWHVFDGSISGTAWSTDAAQRWAAFEFNEAKVIDRYMVASRADYSNYAEAAPKAWEFLASNDGVNWVVLDNVSGETGWGQGEARYFNLLNDTAYLHYKLNFTQTNGHYYTSIGEIDFIEAENGYVEEQIFDDIAITGDVSGTIGSAEIRFLALEGSSSHETLSVEDTASVTSQFHRIGDYDVLSLTGADSAANYEQILNNVSYKNTLGDVNGEQLFEIILKDTDGAVLKSYSRVIDLYGQEINGSAANDNLDGTDSDDALYGLDGQDVLLGYLGDDLLEGGSGADTLTGGNGADRFVFLSANTGTGVDVVTDFSTSDGDALDIADLITSYDPLTDLITDFVQITDDGTDSVLAVDADGGADSFVQIASLLNVTGLTDEAALETSGHLIAA